MTGDAGRSCGDAGCALLLFKTKILFKDKELIPAADNAVSDQATRGVRLRETPAMGLLLALHLGVVFALFLTMPYGKFVHGLYRFAALVRYARESAVDDVVTNPPVATTGQGGARR